MRCTRGKRDARRRKSATMQSLTPHYLLFSEGNFDGDQPGWKFVLQAVGEDKHFSAADNECESRASRLELLAVRRVSRC
jgi:hypothetical protein